MRPRLQLRALSAAEQADIEHIARSRTAAARLVERAKIIWLAHRGHSVVEISQHLKVSEMTLARWWKRFNATGVAGLADERRSGRPPTYTPEEVSVVIATALTSPDSLGLPFASWTLDRLAAYLNERRCLAIKRSRIDELLIAEGLRWRQKEKWFGKRVDPRLRGKKGPLKPSTPRRPKAVSS
jgi:transposase